MVVDQLPPRHQVQLHHPQLGREYSHPGHPQDGWCLFYKKKSCNHQDSYLLQLLHIHKAVANTTSSDGFQWKDVCYK